MPKWEINLQPDHHNNNVQRLETQLKPPFGFTKDFTVSSVELPRRRDMIEKVSNILPRNFSMWLLAQNPKSS